MVYCILLHWKQVAVEKADPKYSFLNICMFEVLTVSSITTILIVSAATTIFYLFLPHL